ncbi:hypothetical protein HMPREF3227_00743 [Corynebacterium sp. CMW7794]|nr:hypothetical protein HMPREF3227_00743 [Corynebacterium sp. CMW7794]
MVRAWPNFDDSVNASEMEEPLLEPLLEVELMSELVRAFATGRPTEVHRTVAEARAATRVAKVFNMRSKSSGARYRNPNFCDDFVAL